MCRELNHHMNYRICTLILFACLAAAQPRRVVPLSGAGKRVALVVGNDSYRTLPRLSNAVRDARSVASALEKTGFETRLLTNATRESFDTALERFIEVVQPTDVALFYY